MKVLWLTNVTMPQLAQEMGLKSSPYGGWLTGAVTALQDNPDVQLDVCCPVDFQELVVKRLGGVGYYGYPRSGKDAHVYNAQTEQWLKQVLEQSKPDLVHIWGTEYPHALSMMRTFDNPDKTIVSIQGLCGYIAVHYAAGLPDRVMHGATLRDLLRRDRLVDQKQHFAMRGAMEAATLANAAHVIGRTCWDHACTTQLAPKAEYHFCNETLRGAFYRNAATWDPEKCERHSIFVSQARYPVKGFHVALQAMPEILRRYPDAKLYTTGKDPRKCSFYRINGYEAYLKKLIKRYNLEEHVVFLGSLSEEKMCDRYLQSNVFLSASSIENSPNSVGEAMLLGVPTVASYVGGTMDLMKDKEEGFLYQWDAHYMIADYVCRVFADDEAAKEMGLRASAHARKTHDPEVNLQTLVQIYHEVSCC